jgi:transcriptional regulator with XRE-family HTH domain
MGRLNALGELRGLAGLSLQVSAAHAEISTNTLWKYELGYGKLLPEQEEFLRRLYRERIDARVKRVSSAIDAETTGASNPSGS